MKNSLIAMGLGLVAGLITASIALADDNYYICYNQDPASTAPANVLVVATSQGMIGVFNAGNINPPRGTFSAPPAAPSLSPSTLNFGAIVWQGKHDEFPDFQSATVNFDAKGAITQASYSFSGKNADYSKCILDGDS